MKKMRVVNNIHIVLLMLLISIFGFSNNLFAKQDKTISKVIMGINDGTIVVYNYAENDYETIDMQLKNNHVPVGLVYSRQCNKLAVNSVAFGDISLSLLNMENNHFSLFNETVSFGALQLLSVHPSRKDEDLLILEAGTKPWHLVKEEEVEDFQKDIKFYVFDFCNNTILSGFNNHERDFLPGNLKHPMFFKKHEKIVNKMMENGLLQSKEDALNVFNGFVIYKSGSKVSIIEYAEGKFQKPKVLNYTITNEITTVILTFE
jgi:hypothetical protein